MLSKVISDAQKLASPSTDSSLHIENRGVDQLEIYSAST